MNRTSRFWGRGAAAGALRALLLGSTVLVAGPVRPADAAARAEDRDRIGRPRLVAPAEGEVLVETAVRFAFEAPPGAGRATLVVAKRPFDPGDWTEVPADPDFVVRDASVTTSLADAGLVVDADTRLWWAVAAREERSGRLRVSEVRSLTARRKFANRVAPSPVVTASREGRVAARRGEAGPARIRLAAGYDFAPALGEPELPAELAVDRSSTRAPDAIDAYLVQFSELPADAERAAVARAGGAVHGYVPDQALLVRMTGAARDRLAAEPGVAWIGDYQPAHKLSPTIDRSAGAARYTALLFADADVDRSAADIVALGARFVDRSDNGVNKMVRFEAAGERLPAIASLSAVAWIEPTIALELHNDLAQWVVQTNINGNRRVWDMGIRGQNQIVMTSDSGIQTDHEQFLDAQVPIRDFGDYPEHRKIIAYKKGSNSPAVEFGDHPGAVFHGTHTACTIVGSDEPNGNLSARDGMAKEARIYFMDIGGTTLLNGVDPFPDLNDLFLPSYVGNSAGAARISSHSWGGAAAGAYTLHAMTVDQFMWSHPDFYVSFSNGNSGTAGSVGSPATAKSSTGAGGTQNGTGTGIYTSTSRGPTQDGRRKPTVCSPGQSVSSASGTPGSYVALSGTSMASPTGTGAVVLMRQYLTEGWYPTGAPVPANGFSPSAALLKAMVVNSANNVVSGFTAPDHNVGYGKVNADQVLYFAGDARKLFLVDHTAGLGAGHFVEYEIHVVDGSIPLEVTLCWTDFPGHPAAAVQLVNDLDLTVSKGATEYRGNNYAGGVSVTGGSYDARNVEEAVLVASPATGVWTVRVAAPRVPMGPQPFALCVTGGVGGGAGALALDRAEYGTTGTVELQVIDANAGPSVDVTLASTTEPGPEVVTLTGADGVYTGTIALTPLAPAAADGMLSVSNGDELVATYVDAAPAATLTARAQVSVATPVITNVRGAPRGDGAVLITWNTDRNASSRVYYGLTPGLELGTADAPGAVLDHAVSITGLTPGATYYYDVESIGLTGGRTRDDLGGAHYRVTAKAKGDLLMVFGQSGFERAATWEGALRAGGYDHDVWAGPLADAPLLGDRSTGMRSYLAVLWQPGFEQYPAFTDAARDVITEYLDGGGRLALCGHDIGWGLSDPTSPAFTVERRAWVTTTLKAVYQDDPPTWSSARGIAGDPISGAYVAGVPYAPFRRGGAGDEVEIAPGSGGTGSYTWINNEGTPDHVGFRWESDTPNGSAALATWGGQPTRLVNMFFEFTAMDPPFNQPSAARNDILDKTLTWLFGRARPTVALTSLDGGETVDADVVDVTWDETAGPGRAITSRTLEYSLDGGASWAVIASGVGPSPYAWDLAEVPNGADARIRIRVADDGAPPLRAADASAASFTLNRPGGDARGPLVVAGSIRVNPNPVVRPDPATLAARISDERTGGGEVAAAEWSAGEEPAAAGAGAPMDGGFGAVAVDVAVVLETAGLRTGSETLWVRGRDAAGNWGPAAALEVQVNGAGQVGVANPVPAAAFLDQNAPNPAAGPTVIRFGLPRRGRIALDVFDLQGRRVARLLEGDLPAGTHLARWDGRDERGGRRGAGIYFYRLTTPDRRLQKRMVVLD